MEINHLLIATLMDTADPLSWSGIAYGLVRALELHVERTTILDRMWVRNPRRPLHHAAMRVLLGGERYGLHLTGTALNHYARQLVSAISETRPDAVLAIGGPSCTAALGSQEIPVAMVSDAPWLAWLEAYSAYHKMPVLGPAYARKEAEAARRSSALFFASTWAAAEAERLYNVPKERVHVTPFGAGWVPECDKDTLADRVRERRRDTLEILFVGRDWERKGGPLALDVVRAINAAGQPARLHIVGCVPEIGKPDLPMVKIWGLLRRNVPEEGAEMRRLFLDSHFLLVPSTAECFGLVFAEALAHGLPAVAHRVHGIPSVVDDGINGVLENVGSSPAAFAHRILDIFRDVHRYTRMASDGRHKYETTLNWNACAHSIVRVLSHEVRVSGRA